MVPRPDLIAPGMPAGVEVYQLTTRPDIGSCHVYMEAQIFTLDSQRFVLQEGARPHWTDFHSPHYRMMLCDLTDGGRLSPLTHERGATGMAVSPDNKTMVYLVDETETNGGRLHVKRVNLDGTGRETITVIDTPFAETGTRCSVPYPFGTIRSDGRMFAISVFLGDGQTEDGPWGLLRIDVETGEVALVLHGSSYCNLHPQYSRSLDPVAMRDILVQENHGNHTDVAGKVLRSVGELGGDIHVIREDGTRMRDMPWGRDGLEFASGHQCWRGRSDWAITTVGGLNKRFAGLIESQAMPADDHRGATHPGAVRNMLHRGGPEPLYSHFATDLAGERLIADYITDDDEISIWVGDFGEPGVDAISGWRQVAMTKGTWTKLNHPHPFLSPDGRTGFFNSNESGHDQAYMITGLDTLDKQA